MCTTSEPNVHRGRARCALRASQTCIAWYQMGIARAFDLDGAYEGWGIFGILIYNYLLFHCLLRHIDVSSKNNENGPYCPLRGGVGDLKEGAPREALTAPRGNHGTTLGVPRTHGRDSSMHTWAPRHVWCAPRGRNGTGPNAAYPLPAQTWGRLSLMRWANWWNHGHNAMV